MAFTPKLTYKGKPLVRKDNELYYGNMTDPYVLYLQITTTKPVGDQQVADKVHLMLLSTDTTKAPQERVMRQTTKIGLYNALDIGSIWLQKANAQVNKKDRCTGVQRSFFAYSSVTSKSRGLPQFGHLGAPSSSSSSSNTAVVPQSGQVTSYCTGPSSASSSPSPSRATSKVTPQCAQLASPASRSSSLT